jgi:hypothetical protein
MQSWFLYSLPGNFTTDVSFSPSMSLGFQYLQPKVIRLEQAATIAKRVPSFAYELEKFQTDLLSQD